MKKIQLTTLILFIAILSYGQSDFRSGFIISLENDSIQGELDYRSNSKNYESCIFKKDGQTTVYGPNEIKGFRFNNDKFFSSQIVNDAFVEVLVLGEISLYRLKEKFYIEKDTSLFELQSIIAKVEKDGKVGYEETSKWRGIVNYLTVDCFKSSSNNIARLTFDEKSFTRFVIKYNNCRGSDYIDYKASKPWTKLEFGIILNMTRSEITTDRTGMYSYMDDSYVSLDPGLGMLVAFSSPRFTERIAVQSEFHIIKSSYSALVELQRPYTEYHDTFIDLTTFFIPLSLKYSLPERKIGQYIEVGVNYDFQIHSNTRHQLELIHGNVVTTVPEDEAFEIRDYQIGFWGGVGIMKSFEKLRGSLSLRYMQMPHLNETKGFNANNSRISLNLIIFKK